MANVPPLVSMEAKMTVATGHANCQQLKDMLSKEDASSMVVVMASSHKISTTNPPSPPQLMDPGLLAVACSGSWEKLQSFLNGDPPPIISRDRSMGCSGLWKKLQSFLQVDARPTSMDGTIGSSAIQQPSRDKEALLRVSFLDGVTIQGDTFLHVMATYSVGDDLIQDGLGGLIRSKAVQRLSARNNNGDTPMHSAARASRSQMVSFLVHLARGNDANTVKPLLEIENQSGWTVLHEAVRVGNNEIVTLLMKEDPELARFPNHGTSPMYLAILLENKIIAETLYKESGGVLSYSGPNRQNALHAAVLRSKDLTTMLLGWNSSLAIQQDEMGSTPLHFASSVPWQRDAHAIHLLLMKANPNALYQPDHKGSLPIHVAASVSGFVPMSYYIKNAPNTAGMRDARGKTFLHVATEKQRRWTVRYACKNQSLSWILNMQDNDGNTALHLAVQVESLRMFRALFANMQVDLNLTNEKGDTPLDIAWNRCETRGLRYHQNSETKIHDALTTAGAKRGICRQDYVENNIVQAGEMPKSSIEMVKEGTQNMCIGSVLIATVTFGATFAMPGGYRSPDDHTNGGTPVLAGRYAFDTFTLANSLAFTLSVMATISLMFSGTPMVHPDSRLVHLGMAYYLMSISVKSFVAAFAIGTYMMLAPVAYKTAVAVCVMSSLVLLYQTLELIVKHLFLVVPFCVRKGIFNTFIRSLCFIAFHILLLEFWPIIVIFCSTLTNYPVGNLKLAVQPPTSCP